MKSPRKKLNKREILKSLHLAFWSGVVTAANAIQIGASRIYIETDR